jgi:hypothetical protein
MLDEAQPLVHFKLSLLQRCFPAKDAVVFGDMYVVEGGYTLKCLELGCGEALLIDAYETPAWLETRRANPGLDFLKGDFSNPLFMRSFERAFELGVLFDILLHQPPLLSTLHLVLEKVASRVCIVQPMLREQPLPNSLIYLPGTAAAELLPYGTENARHRMSDAMAVNRTRWIWAMTGSLLRTVLQGEGFEVTYSEELECFPNRNYFYLGLIAERRRQNPLHWSRYQTLPGLYREGWEDLSRSPFDPP